MPQFTAPAGARCRRSDRFWSLRKGFQTVAYAFGMLAVAFCAQGQLASGVGTNDPFCVLLNPGNQGPRTLRMIARLRDLARAADPREAAYLSAEMAERCRIALNGSTDPKNQAFIRYQYALNLLRSGRNEEALMQFQGMLSLLHTNGLELGDREQLAVELNRGLAYLRLGEQDNCLLNHNSESCLMPIQGAGIHRISRGSKGAVQIFNNILRASPNQLGTRWLLNIAQMTLGEYPHGVPEAWLVPASVFASEYPLARFPEAAAAAGLDVDDLAGGCIAEDFDGDGLLDIMASSWSWRGQLRYFRNNGDGTFAERTSQSGLEGLTGSLNILQTDYNNDGHADVFMLRGGWLGKGGHHPNSLLRNNGNGTFEDVTEEAGLLSFRPTQTAVWFDYNGDGWLDLFIGNETTTGDTNHCELYRNNGNGTFTECAAESGAAVVGFVKGVVSGDYNNDGRPDLYISCRDQYNILLRNEGPGTNEAGRATWQFRDATSEAGVREPLASFPCWFFDYDNDGNTDLFVTGYSAILADIAADYMAQPHPAHRARLYRNRGDGTFADVTREAGVYKVMHAMGCNFGDFDNDGWLDFYVGTGDPEFSTLIPNRAFRNDGGKRFQEVTTAGGFGHLQKGHGIAFADLDNNGSQDVYAVMGGAYSGDNYRNALFVNPGSSNRWITLKLEGAKSNRAAIGARICVIVQGDSGRRLIYKTVGSGGSFGASPLRQEIGLGSTDTIHRVEIYWPATRHTQVIRGLKVNSFYHIREGDTEARPVTLKQFALATKIDPAKLPQKHHKNPLSSLR